MNQTFSSADIRRVQMFIISKKLYTKGHFFYFRISFKTYNVKFLKCILDCYMISITNIEETKVK